MRKVGIFVVTGWMIAVQASAIVTSIPPGDTPTFVISGGSYQPTGVNLLRVGGRSATVNQTGGDLEITESGYLRFCGTGNSGTYNYSGGSLVCNNIWYADNSHGIFNVIGSGGADVIALVNVDMDAAGSAVSEMNFIFDSNGVSTVTTPQGFRVGSNTVFNIDGSAYAGPGDTFVLVDAGWIANGAAFVSTNLVVTGFSGYSAAAELDLVSDQLTVTVKPLMGYDAWAGDYPALGFQTNRTDDAESDGVNNFLEYALGGDPTVDDAASILPTGELVEEGGSNVLEYVYRRRTDVTSLVYGLLLEEDLVNGLWTNNAGTAYETGSGAVETDVELVTNHVPTIESVQFVRLSVWE